MELTNNLSSFLYSVFLAPRGNVRMSNLGILLAQQYLSPFDHLIGLIGEAGSGKSMIIKGMFPGLELTNDDEGVNIRPLPILKVDDTGFFSAHTYHLDVRFESGLTQMHVLAAAVIRAVEKGKRVVVEHFDLLYPYIDRNAELLIGVGEEVIVTRPNIFGPKPQDIAEVVFKSIIFRRMVHTAEDLCMHLHPDELRSMVFHGDVRHGFVLGFRDKPTLDPVVLEQEVMDLIAQDLMICYHDESHISIGDEIQPCAGPRVHVRSTGEITNFTILKEFPYDPVTQKYLLVGLVGDEWKKDASDLNRIHF
jgi:hypothetical protein